MLRLSFVFLHLRNSFQSAHIDFKIVKLHQNEVTYICCCKVISVRLEHANYFDICLHTVLLQHKVVPFLGRMCHFRIYGEYRHSIIPLRLFLLFLSVGAIAPTLSLSSHICALIGEELQQLLRLVQSVILVPGDKNRAQNLVTELILLLLII